MTEVAELTVAPKGLPTMREVKNVAEVTELTVAQTLHPLPLLSSVSAEAD